MLLLKSQRSRSGRNSCFGGRSSNRVSGGLGGGWEGDVGVEEGIRLGQGKRDRDRSTTKRKVSSH